jgi:hypothetical protein
MGYVYTEAMTLHLPPCRHAEKLALEIKLARAEVKGDAVNEAWAAHLSGDCPLKATRRFLARERRARKRPLRLIGKAKQMFGEHGEML